MDLPDFYFINPLDIHGPQVKNPRVLAPSVWTKLSS